MTNLDKLLIMETEDNLQNIEVPSSLYAFAKKVPEMNQNKTYSPIKSKNSRWKKQLLSWGSAAAIITLGISISQTSSANFFENVPFLKMENNESFKENFSNMLDAAKNDQFASLGHSTEDNGIKMVVTDAIYDGGQVALSYSVQTSHKLEGTNIDSSNFKILFDGDRLSWSSIQDFSKVSDNKYAGAMKIWVPEEKLYEENMNVSIQFSKVLGMEGKWKYNLDLDQIRNTFKTDSYIKLARTSFHISEVSFTPLNTEIAISGENKDNFVISVIDSEGNRHFAQNYYEFKKVKQLQYQPFSLIPDELTLEVKNGAEKKRIVIPIKKH